MKILCAGDWHANTAYALQVIRRAADLGAREIWQCGDFGYWPNFDTGTEFLISVNAALHDAGIDLFFVDGNHEYHPGLLHDKPYYYNLPSHNRKERYTKINYAPRCLVRVLAGVKILYIGGAVSVDRKWRTPGHDWFSEETISIYQSFRLANVGKVDIVIAHDAPTEANLQLMKNVWPVADVRMSEVHRRLLSDCLEYLQPELWVHGHYHQRATTIIENKDRKEFRMECLAEDMKPLDKTTLLLELEDGEWRILDEPT